MVRNPRSAIVWAYRPEDCSLQAPKGPLTAIAGSFPLAALGEYMSAARVMPKWLTKVTFLCSTFSLFGNTLSQDSVRFSSSVFIMTGLSFQFIFFVCRIR